MLKKAQTTCHEQSIRLPVMRCGAFLPPVKNSSYGLEILLLVRDIGKTLK